MRPKIGLIGVTAQLYQEKVPDLIKGLADFSGELKRTCAAFAAIEHVPVVYTATGVEQGCARLEEQGVAGIILVFLSYSPSLIIAPAFRKRRIPLLIWNTQRLQAVGPKFGNPDMFLNHGMHGVQDLSSVLGREGRSFSLVTGHYRDKAVVDRVKQWCTAAAVAAALRKSRIGRIGGRFQDMGDFAVPDARITKLLGPAVRNIPPTEIAAASGKVGRGEVRKIIDADRAAYAVAGDLDARTHQVTSRLEAAFRNVVARERFDGLAVNFMGLRGNPGCEVIPFAALCKLMAEGLGYAGEGDALCAVSVLILQRLRGCAAFTEMFTTDYRNSRIFMSHMGESNPKMAVPGRRIRLVRKDMALIKAGLATSILLFRMKPGPVTLFNIAPGAQGFSFIVTAGEILDAPLFPDILCPHFLLKPRRSVEDFLSDYSRLGGTHHLALAYGDARPALRMLGGIMNTPVQEI